MPQSEQREAQAIVQGLQLKAPDKLNYDATDMALEWKKWREELELYASLAMGGRAESTKIELFKYLIGQEGREVYKTLEIEGDAAARTIANVLDAFDKHYNPKKTETFERYKFFTRNHEEGENFDKYYSELRRLSDTCNFQSLRDSLIRDRIICGVRDAALRERLLREMDLTLEKCVTICRTSELSKEQSKTLENQQSVNQIKKKKFGKGKQRGQGQRQSGGQGHRHSGYTPKKQNGKCTYCGYSTHGPSKEDCPANGKTCMKCKGKNHFAAVCRTKPKVHHMEHNIGNDNEEEYYTIKSVELQPSVHTVNSSKCPSQIYANMHVEGHTVKFQLDSGATCNIIPSKYVNNSEHSVVDKGQKLCMYNKTTVKPLGSTVLKMINPCNGAKYKVEFVVLDEPDVTPILGSRAVQQMGLMEVKYENICAIDTELTAGKLLKDYADVFSGTGKLEGKYHIVVDENVKPVIHPPRKVPIAIQHKLKAELDRLEEQQIITPVTKPTEWVSSLVIVDRPEKLRVCIDPMDLNTAIKRSHYPLPTIEDILPSLGKAKIFSVLDAKNGFFHIELDEESSYLTTFNTPYGRYRYLRMPMGISSGPEEFQRRQDQVVEGLRNVKCVADDILVYGEGDTPEEATKDHDRCLIGLMDRCREKNLKLNANKLKLRLKQVPFIGHLVTDTGLKPDPEKVKAVKEMPNPTDVAGVLRFAGFVNYLSKFIPQLSEHMEPLRQLTQREVEWHWLPQHDAAVQKVKDAIVSETVLKYYDSSKELTLQCDASDFGLGIAMLQNQEPIAYASRKLTDTERRYAQIEKELLAVVFGMEKFHQYTYGRKVNVQSDHRPLESIMKKPLHAAPKRLQRMMLRLQIYDVDLKWRPGKDMHLADFLSRAPLNQTKLTPIEEQIEHINMVQYLPIAEPRLRDIQNHTEKDETLQALKRIIIHGWPNDKVDVSITVRPYFGLRDELTVQNGIIFRGDRAVIPCTLRKDMIQRIHASHIGIEGCLRRARECVYWPGMNAQIKDSIEKCDVCRTYSTKQQKETMIPHEVPNRPWAKVGTDIMTFDSNDYLVTVDYFSNFWEIDYLPKATSNTVIQKLKAQFARHGIPDTLISDNGPQFDSSEFRNFAAKWHFEHVTSSPGYAQSNGKAEQAVKSAKNILRKAKEAKSDPYLAILDYRNTPTQSMGSSPTQRLMSRRTKTLLPTSGNLLRPSLAENAWEKLQQTKERQTLYYDRDASDLPPLKPGDTVRIEPGKYEHKWKRAEIRRQIDSRSYEVVTEDNTMLRRNRKHLRKTKEQAMATHNDQHDDVLFDGGSTAGKPTTTPEVETGTEVQNNVEPRRSGRIRTAPVHLKDYVCSK